MNKPELFSAANANSRKINLHFVNENLKRIKWNKEGKAVIDLGCGDGSFTALLKQSYIPDNYKIVACDVSENMINFAKERYQDEKTTFRVWDIGGALPKEFAGAFNHVFSFLTLHWIHDQKQAFQNIYDLLVKDGDCLLTLVGDMPVFDVYLALSETQKWKLWLRNLKTVPLISPYHKIENPEQKVQETMKTIGYQNIYVKHRKWSLVYKKVEEFKDLMRALDPFNMPIDVFEDFLEDILKMSLELGHFHTRKNDSNELELGYYLYLIDVYATK